MEDSLSASFILLPELIETCEETESMWLSKRADMDSIFLTGDNIEEFFTPRQAWYSFNTELSILFRRFDSEPPRR